MVMRVYVDLKTDNAKRRDMIKATNGVFPFDGNSGVYGRGLHELELVSARSGLGGGSAWGTMVDEFIRHIAFLAKHDDHLYSAFQ